jgi:hypothetical protein
MNIFASERIKPANIKFPKGMDKLEWEHVETTSSFDANFAATKVGHVVIDCFHGENINGLRVAKAIVELSIDKHQPLPTLLLVGPDQNMRKEIETYISNSKRWIDIATGK